MTQTIRIIAAILNTQGLTLYKENGETLYIAQGDPRLRKILDTATPQIIAKQYADIELDAIQGDTTYAEFEKTSGGRVSFFRIAKDKLKSLFGGKKEVPAVTPVPLLTVGPATEHIQQASIHEVSEADEVAAAQEAVLAKTRAVIEEITKHATPASSEQFNEEGITKQGNIVEENGSTISNHGVNDDPDTIVAVVDGKVIPDVQKIKTQFSRANKLGSTIGVENFLKRLARVIDQRSHSVEDLLKFLERGDLPIADDGTILIYKVLRRHGDKYVDYHTKRVEQWVGAYVCMDPSLVDHNRNNECSNGLHVARRGYIREFSGDLCVLAKLAPEDVIAVPSYDANKMRVCGYHIIAELTEAQYSRIRSNQPLTNESEGQILIAKAMKGDHIGKTHEVRIHGQSGQDVRVTNLNAPIKVEIAPVEHTPIQALENPEQETIDEPIDPKAIVKEVHKLSRKEEAAKMVKNYLANPNAENSIALKAYKKASKNSWEKLGVPNDVVNMLMGLAPKPKAKKKPVKASKARKVAKAAKPVGSPRERILTILNDTIGKIDAQEVLQIKKEAKKSWEALGVTEAQVSLILTMAKS